MSSTVRQIIFWVLILLGAVLLYKAFANSQGGGTSTIDVGLLNNKIQNGEIVKLTIKQNEVMAVDRQE